MVTVDLLPRIQRSNCIWLGISWMSRSFICPLRQLQVYVIVPSTHYFVDEKWMYCTFKCLKKVLVKYGNKYFKNIDGCILVLHSTRLLLLRGFMARMEALCTSPTSLLSCRSRQQAGATTTTTSDESANILKMSFFNKVGGFFSGHWHEKLIFKWLLLQWWGCSLLYRTGE